MLNFSTEPSFFTEANHLQVLLKLGWQDSAASAPESKMHVRDSHVGNKVCCYLPPQKSVQPMYTLKIISNS